MPGDIPLYIADGPVPRDYVVPNSGELLPLQVEGTIDGTSAASQFYAVLQVLDPNGRSMGKYISSAIAAGASADVTWFPRVTSQASSTPSGGGLTLLYDSGYLGSAQASIDTGANGIAAGFTSLLMAAQLRTDGAVGTDWAGMRLNGDTGNNYDWHDTLTLQTVVSAEAVQGNNYGRFGVINGNLQGATRFPAYFAFLPYYTGTVNDKVILPFSSTPSQTQSRLGGFEWKSTAAVNRITVGDYHNGGNMDVGSRLTVWGV